MTPFQYLTKEMRREFQDKSGLTGMQFNSAYDRYFTAENVAEIYYEYAKQFLAAKIIRKRDIDYRTAKADAESFMHLFEFVHKAVWKAKRNEALRAESNGFLTISEVQAQFHDFAVFDRYKNEIHIHPFTGVENGSRRYSTIYSAVPTVDYYNPADVRKAIEKAIDSIVEYNDNMNSYLNTMKTRLADLG